MSMEIPQAKAESKKEAYKQLMDKLKLLEDLNGYLRGHVLELSVQKHTAATVKPSESRTINLQRLDSTYVMSDATSFPDGKETKLSYEISPTDRGSNSNKNGHLSLVPKTAETEFDFNHRGHGMADCLKVFYGRKVLAIEEDGLHVESPAQKEWDYAWRNFQRTMAGNEKFFRFLERLTDDEEIPFENKKWATDFMHGNIDVQDSEKFLNDVKEYWKNAVGGALPAKSIPKFESSQRPPDDIYDHQDVQKTVDYIYARLKDAFEWLDKKLMPQGSPYRESARKE